MIFPALQQQAHGYPLIYLDDTAIIQKPLAMVEAIDAYYREQNENVCRAASANYAVGKRAHPSFA